MSTGFPPKVRAIIEGRAEGRCEAMFSPVCNGRVEELHHRRPRGAGGTKAPAVNRAANALAVCQPCHQLIESQRAAARAAGFLVSLHETHPAQIAVLYRNSRLVILDDFGGTHDMAVPF